MGKEEKNELTKKTMKLLLPVVQKKSKGQENVKFRDDQGDKTPGMIEQREREEGKSER